MLGIDHALRVLDDLRQEAVGVVSLVKNHSVLELLRRAPALLDRARDMVANAPAALPELKDLDPQEAGKLAEACYKLVQDVVAAAVA